MRYTKMLFLTCDGKMMDGKKCSANDVVPVRVMGGYIIPKYQPDEDGVTRPWLLGSSKVELIDSEDPNLRGRDLCPECRSSVDSLFKPGVEQ